MRPKRVLQFIAFLTLAAARLPAQGVAELVAAGDSAYARFDVEAALGLYEAAIAIDSSSADALGKASRTVIDIAEPLEDAARQKELFARGAEYARRAVAADSSGPDVWFHLARALGRTALSVGVRDRVRYAVEIREAALKSLAMDPSHAGALHVLGVWNAEVKRLSGFELFFARRFLGGGVLGKANWKDAVDYMERAVAADPGRVSHRLDLGAIYADVGEKEKARANFEAVINATTRTDYNDDLYKKQAAERLKRLK
jgi:tetratricopeptide (TPR) repeat protein